MFVDHDLWPPPPSPPPRPAPRTLTDAQEKRIGWAIVAVVLAMIFGPLAGSSAVVGVIAVWRALIG